MENFLGGERGIAGKVWSQMLVLALAAPSLLCGYTHLPHTRRKEAPKDCWVPAPAFHTSQCSVSSGGSGGKGWLLWERNGWANTSQLLG